MWEIDENRRGMINETIGPWKDRWEEEIEYLRAEISLWPFDKPQPVQRDRLKAWLTYVEDIRAELADLKPTDAFIVSLPPGPHPSEERINEQWMRYRPETPVTRSEIEAILKFVDDLRLAKAFTIYTQNQKPSSVADQTEKVAPVEIAGAETVIEVELPETLEAPFMGRTDY